MKRSTTKRRRWALAVVVVVWTLVAWGGRIGLLTGAEEWTSTLRIGGSLLIGLAAAAVLVFPQLAPMARPVLYLFAAWSVVVWTRGLIVNWSGSGSLPFKLVHTVLAIGFYLIAWWAVAAARSDPVAGPDEGDGEEQGEGEAARLAKG